MVLKLTMSEDDIIDKKSTKRKVESDDEDQERESVKRGKIEPQAEAFQTLKDDSHNRQTIEETIKAIDRIQYELNMGNNFADSPDPSDHDTPPESEDESASEDMFEQAHALGYAACVRETFRYLESCGIPVNDPIYKQLKSRFIETNN